MTDLQCYRCGTWDGEKCACRDGQTIFHGDCRELMRTLPTSYCELAITDPPYGISHSSKWESSWRGTVIAGDTDTSCRDSALDRFADAAVFGTWKTPPIAGTRGVVVWNKGPASGMGDLSFPWKLSFELIYIRGYGWAGDRDEGVLSGPVVVTWESKGRYHPHEKPLWLPRHFLLKHPSPVVVDPFLGSGTTLVAAKQLGRRGIGIELEEKYCQIAAERLRQGVLEWTD